MTTWISFQGTSIVIRILLPLILAVVAFFGPWLGTYGFDLGEPTIGCLLDFQLSVSGACAPSGDLKQMLVTYTMILGGVGAVLSILGLLPLIGRLTSLVVMAAGLSGLAASVMFVLAMVNGGQGFDVVGLGWGAIATGVLGLMTAVVGLGGVRGESQDY
ncbi:MAG: hypothetical protein AAF788_00685 [Pseudomonadota bacterium]